MRARSATSFRGLLLNNGGFLKTMIYETISVGGNRCGIFVVLKPQIKVLKVLINLNFKAANKKFSPKAWSTEAVRIRSIILFRFRATTMRWSGTH